MVILLAKSSKVSNLRNVRMKKKKGKNQILIFLFIKKNLLNLFRHHIFTNLFFRTNLITFLIVFDKALEKSYIKLYMKLCASMLKRIH